MGGQSAKVCEGGDWRMQSENLGTGISGGSSVMAIPLESC